jgi:competence CoiA-like predicted nuclease
MKYAHDELGNRVEATPNTTAVCPCCDSAVKAYCGDVIQWHWEHANAKDCDSYYEPMTRWHIGWQDQFPKDWQEITIKRDGIHHRADVQIPNGRVIEFQNSPISLEEIIERSKFYQPIIWVLNFEDIAKNFKTKTKGKRARRSINDRQCDISWKDHIHSLIYRKCDVYYVLVHIQKYYASSSVDGMIEIVRQVIRQHKLGIGDSQLNEKIKLVKEKESEFYATFGWKRRRKSWIYAFRSLKTMNQKADFLFDFGQDKLFWCNTLYENGNGAGYWIPKDRFLRHLERTSSND